MTQPFDFNFDRPADRCIICGGAIRPWADKVAYGRAFHYDRCQKCGLVFVNPRPTVASLDLFYQHWIPDREPTASSSDEAVASPLPTASAANRRFLQQVVAIGPSGGTFLDVGSGGGGATAAAAECGYRVTALEVDSRQVTATGKLANVVAVQGLFESFEAPEASFDVILMSHVLEHVFDPAAWIAKACRLLKPGGALWILVPNLDGIYRRLWKTGDPYFIPPTHLNHFNPKSLANLCRRMGMRIEMNRGYFHVDRNVLSKRVRAGEGVKKMIEGMTIALNGALSLATRLTQTGVFLEVCARK